MIKVNKGFTRIAVISSMTEGKLQRKNSFSPLVQASLHEGRWKNNYQAMSLVNPLPCRFSSCFYLKTD